MPLQCLVSHFVWAAHDQGTRLIVVENAQHRNSDVDDRAHFASSSMDSAPPDPSPGACGSKQPSQPMRRPSSTRPSHLAYDSIASQPTIPEDESKNTPEPSGPQQTKSSLWQRMGLGVTLGSTEWDILLVSTCLKLLLFPA